MSIHGVSLLSRSGSPAGSQPACGGCPYRLGQRHRLAQAIRNQGSAGELTADSLKPETLKPETSIKLNDDTRYQLLRILQYSPDVSQRELARRMGISLGKTNYCLRAVMEKGWVKARNFRNSRNKAAYMYVLTPSGITAKARITRRFLKRKIVEYEQLRIEIEELRAQVENV